MSFSADEFQLNSNSAYIPKCINILRLFLKKKISKTYRVFTTFITQKFKKTKSIKLNRASFETKKKKGNRV